MNNMQNVKEGTNVPSHDEIDIIELTKKIVVNRIFILKITIIFILIGLFIAIFSPIEYTSTSIMVPQTGENQVNNNLGGLAAIAGINLGSSNAEILSMEIYPDVVASIPFQKELMQTPLKLKDFSEEVTLFDYFTKEEYQKFNMMSFIKKYTIGLPGVIIGIFKKERENEHLIIANDDKSLLTINRDEKKCIDILQSILSIEVNDKKGYVKLSAMMPEALSAAQLVERAQTLLQQYITAFKIEKKQFDLDFVEERYMEAKNEFERIQQERAIFIDANQNISRARASTERERLDANYNLAFTVYSELAKQLEQSKIQVKETTPILTIIDPPTIPIERSKPRRALICIGFTFLGFILGVSLVFIIPFFNEVFPNKRLNNLVK